MKNLILIGIFLLSACGEQAENEAESLKQAMEDKKNHIHDENCNHNHNHDEHHD